MNNLTAMAEADSDTQPVFIDVSTAPDQYPMSYQPSDNTDEVVDRVTTAVIEVKAENEDVPKQNILESLLDGDMAKPSLIRIKCSECNRYTAESEEQLHRHIRKMHRGLNPFQCYMCDYSTYNKPLFEEHVRIHRGIKPFKCAQCPYRSASKKNAKKHEMIHRPNNPLKCPSCPFIARHERSLNHHRQQHNKVSVDELYKQMKNEQSGRPSEYVCKHCGHNYNEARKLASHQRHAKKCEECDTTVCSKYLYKRHMSLVHARSPENATTFRCSLCPWQGNHTPRVLLHLIHHPQRVDEDAFDVTILRRFGILP